MSNKPPTPVKVAKPGPKLSQPKQPLLDLSEKVRLSLRGGDEITTELRTIRKIAGSRLDTIVTEGLQANRTSPVAMDEDPTIFRHVIAYLRSDRTELPAEGDSLRPKVIEKVHEMGLDLLTTKIARDFQRILDK